MMKLNKNIIALGIAVVAVAVTAALVWANSSPQAAQVLAYLRIKPGMSDQEIAQKSVDYLNKSVLQGQTATLGTVSEASGMVKLQVKIGANTFDSYATKDGKLFFPEAFNLETAPANQTGQAAPANQTASATASTPPKATPQNLAKADTPEMDVFLVSRCPFGLQIQRAINDALKTVPQLANYIKIKYIGAVQGTALSSMHGDAEGVENLRQICIREEQPAKYWPYVACQMKAGDTAGCQSSAGIDGAKLTACTTDPARGIAYAQKDFALDAKYNITGSPTVVVNGAEISEYDFGGRSADSIKTIICDASKTPEAFCAAKLNANQAATSFSVSYAVPATAAANAVATASGSTGSNCAPATAQ